MPDLPGSRGDRDRCRGRHRREVRNADVTHLGMEEAVQHAPIGDCAAADSRAHGEIKEIRQPLCGSPASFAEGGSVHVRIEPDGYAEGLADGAGEIAVAPAGLGCGSDVPAGGGARVQVHRAEGGDADGLQLPAAEKLDARADGGIRRSCGDLDEGEIVRSGSRAAHELGAAGFDCAKHVRNSVARFAGTGGSSFSGGQQAVDQPGRGMARVVPITAPARTSLRKCMPSMMREAATLTEQKSRGIAAPG